MSWLHNLDALTALNIPVGFCVILPHVPFFATICIDMTYVLAKLGCLALVFMPYVPVHSARA